MYVEKLWFRRAEKGGKESLKSIILPLLTISHENIPLHACQDEKQTWVNPQIPFVAAGFLVRSIICFFILFMFADVKRYFVKCSDSRVFSR